MVIVALRILSPTEKAYMAARLQTEPVVRAEERVQQNKGENGITPCEVTPQRAERSFDWLIRERVDWLMREPADWLMRR